MNSLVVALVVLVSIWSIIFIILAIAMIVILKDFKRALDRVNNILRTGEQVAEGVGTVSKMAIDKMGGLISRTSDKQTKKISSKLLKKQS